MRKARRYHRPVVLISLLACWLWPGEGRAATLREETVKAWELYKALTEERIETELASQDGFLVRDFLSESDQALIRATLARGEVYVDKMETHDQEGGEVKIPKGLVHHWYGSVFVPGADIDSLLAWVQAYDRHQDYFEEVEDSRLLSQSGDRFEAFLRLRRKKVITVHYNTEHRVIYTRWGSGEASSRSEATRIAELKDPGTAQEKENPIGDDRGFLWRLDSYWRFKQVPEGVEVECESISLSRTIPVAFRWVVKPFINSVPRESLEAAMHPMREAFANVPE